jgi:hypothetical protein
MSKKRIATLLLTAFMTMFAMPANLSAPHSVSSLECDGGIVSRGDSEADARDKCGDPQKVAQEDADSPIIWFYDFGPSEFVCYVSFTNGIVERLQMGGYGN